MPAALLYVLCILTAGCASSPKPEAVIHESQKGAVYLEPMDNRYLQAAHPISLPADTISRILRGVLVQSQQSAVESLFETEEKARRAFSTDEVAFLTPLLVTALSQAAPSQQIRFRLIHQPRDQNKLFSMSESGGAAVGSSNPPSYGPQFETSTGTLYVYGLSLYLTLTEYRQKPSRPDSINMPNRRLPASSELDHVEILFTPKDALRPESYQKPGLFGTPRLTPIIVDYELLAKLPAPKAPTSRPVQSGGGDGAKDKAPAPAVSNQPFGQPPAAKETGTLADQELQSVKEQMLKKDAELETVKEELRAIKKQLAEQEAERQKPKKKKPADPLSPVKP
jgi:hypothetical protein